MTIASDLWQRHIQTLVDDNAQWQTLIADDILWASRESPILLGVSLVLLMALLVGIALQIRWLNKVIRLRTASA